MNSPLSDFQEGQWWIAELDKAATGASADFKRAVAVVHHMLRSAAENEDQRKDAARLAEANYLWRCTVCGRTGTVGRCCGEETREPVRAPNAGVQRPA